MCDNALFNLLGQGPTCTVVGAAVDDASNQWVVGLADTMRALMTYWLDVDSPNLDSSPGTAIDIIKQLTLPLVAFGAIIGILVAAGRMVYHAEPGKNILRGLLLMMLVSVGGASITAGLVAGFDALAQYILDTGFDGKSVGERLLAFAADPQGLGLAVLMIISILGILASLIQIVIVFVRGVILALLVAMLPIAAGATITQTGMDWLKKLVGWIFAFAVYKLTASIIYATAFAMIGTAQDGNQTLMGLSMIILAVVALPALLRLLPPSIAASGGGGGGGALGAVGAALATGSVMMSGRGGAATQTAKGNSGGSVGGQRAGLKELAMAGAPPGASGGGSTGGSSTGGGGSAVSGRSSGNSSGGVGTPAGGGRTNTSAGTSNGGNGSSSGGYGTSGSKSVANDDDSGPTTGGDSSSSGRSGSSGGSAGGGNSGGASSGSAEAGSSRPGLRQLQTPSGSTTGGGENPTAPAPPPAGARRSGPSGAQRAAQAGQRMSTGSSRAARNVVGQQDEERS